MDSLHMLGNYLAQKRGKKGVPTCTETQCSQLHETVVILKCKESSSSSDLAASMVYRLIEGSLRASHMTQIFFFFFDEQGVQATQSTQQTGLCSSIPAHTQQVKSTRSGPLGWSWNRTQDSCFKSFLFSLSENEK